MQTEIVNHLGKAETVTLTAAASPGDIIRTADGRAAICGMSLSTSMPYAIGDKVSAETDVIAWVPCASGTTISVGGIVGWNNSTKLAVPVAADFFIGYAVQAKTSGQTRALVRFGKGAIPSVPAS